MKDCLDDISEKVDHLLQGGLTSQQLLRANLGLLQAKVREDRGEGVSNKKTSHEPEPGQEQTISGPLGFWRFPIVNAFLQSNREQVTLDRMHKNSHEITPS